ncbi:MAG: GNAT family N-acetyltransferase [Bacteroidota bacterium]
MNIQIRLLTKDLKDDYLFLFDNMVHKENPEWSKCYCNDYHFLGDVETCTRNRSRVMIIDRIDENELQGYLVFHNGKAVGWCNVNNRANYQRLLRDYDLIDNPDDKVCSVVCFLIHPDYRRRGISQKIIETVIEDGLQEDYDYLESYPKKGKSGTSNFNGSLELYKRNGFKVYKEQETYYVMRKSLKVMVVVVVAISS